MPRRAASVVLWALFAFAPATASDDEKTDEPVDSGVQEKVVVSASATGRERLDAPAAVDVLDGDELAERPGELLIDQLRRVPGVSVVQFSARDVNIAPRAATGHTNKSTLVLADGRNLYQDFFGFVMWEFAPTDMSLVDRVEVVRGPGSALWGANAVGGLVHVMTKSPRDTLGGQVRIDFGSYNSRRVEARQSFLAGPWAVRVSAGFNEMDPFDRPQTIVNFFGEEIDPDLGLIEQDRRESGTRQPRLDLRADWEGPDGAVWILQGGWAQTRGWIATGLGPFDIDPSTAMSYVQGRYRKGPYEFQVYSNVFDGDATNLINEIPFLFTSTLTQSSFRGGGLLGLSGAYGWGVEFEQSTYDLSIAPAGDKRTKGGAFFETDLFLSERFKLVAGGRLDHFRETIGTVLSPRVALRFKPGDNHTVRLAWGRAFRSPTVVESDLFVPAFPVAIVDWEAVDQLAIDEGIFPPDQLPEEGFFALLASGVCEIYSDMQVENCGSPVGEVPTYVAVTGALGSRDVVEERTDSLELGYAGQFGPWGISATVFRTRSRDGIDFLQQGSYGIGADGQPGTADDIVLPTDPDGDGILEAPPVDLCPLGFELITEFGFADLCTVGPVPYNLALSIMLDGRIPSLFRFENGSRNRNQGLELGLTWDGPVSWWINYSLQDDVRTDGVPMRRRIRNVVDETSSGLDLDGDGLVGDTSEFANVPARNRLSVGAQVQTPRWFASATADFVDETFWQDVQTQDFWGWIDSYTLVGLSGGYRWPDHGLELSGQVTNLLDDDIRQHIFGDIIGLRASVGLTYRWADRSASAASGRSP